MTELMVVMLILGLLAALAVPAYSAFTRKARYAEAKQLMGTVARDLQVVSLEQGGYPADADPNTSPAGVSNWPSAMPFDATLDYDHWAIGGGRCYVQLAFWGDENLPRYGVFQEVASPGELKQVGDNLVLAVAAYDCEYASPGPVN